LAAAQRYASGASWPAVGQTLLTVLSQAVERPNTFTLFPGFVSS
jgi:hypothetical protein